MPGDQRIEPPLEADEAARVEIIRGPNITPFPELAPLARRLAGAQVMLKLGDNITTDHIMPAGGQGYCPMAFQIIPGHQVNHVF